MINPFIVGASTQFYKGKYALYGVLFDKLIGLLPLYHREIEECTKSAYALWKFCVEKAPVESAKHKDILENFSFNDLGILIKDRKNLVTFLEGLLEVLLVEMHTDIQKERIILVNHIRKLMSSIEHLTLKYLKD